MKNQRTLTFTIPFLLVAATCVAAKIVLTIHEINRQKRASGVYVTQGYVAKIYAAPACPPGAQCKPSMKDNIVISETKKQLESYDLSEAELVVFTTKTAAPKRGRKYRFQIEITDQKTTGQPLNDIVLLNFRALD